MSTSSSHYIEKGEIMLRFIRFQLMVRDVWTVVSSYIVAGGTIGLVISLLLIYKHDFFGIGFYWSGIRMVSSWMNLIVAIALIPAGIFSLALLLKKKAIPVGLCWLVVFVAGGWYVNHHYLPYRMHPSSLFFDSLWSVAIFLVALFSIRAKSETILHLSRLKCLNGCAFTMVMILVLLNGAVLFFPTFSIQNQRANVFLFVIDSLRADHLGCYGYHRNTSPAIDSYSAGSWLFSSVVSQSSWTKTSMASMLTGQYPTKSGGRTAGAKLQVHLTTIGEVLRQLGYRTICFQTNPWLQKKFGFAQGFDEYRFLPWREPFTESNAENLVDIVLERFSEPQSGQVFLYVHFMDIHGPYNPPVEYRLFGESSVDLYDAQIRYFDYHLVRLLGKLQKNGYFDNAVVIIASDHGEEFYEHGMDSHGKTLYNEVTNVPLIIRMYGENALTGQWFSKLTGNVDVLPIVLNLISQDAEIWLPQLLLVGNSLLKDKESAESQTRYLYSQVGRNSNIPTKEIVSVVEDSRFKLIRSMDFETNEIGEEVYDLYFDAVESTNLLNRPEYAETVARLRKALNDYLRLDEYDESQEANETTELDPETIKQLKSLGYLQ